MSAECRRIGAPIIRSAVRIEQPDFCVFVRVFGKFFLTSNEPHDP